MDKCRDGFQAEPVQEGTIHAPLEVGEEEEQPPAPEEVQEDAEYVIGVKNEHGDLRC